MLHRQYVHALCRRTFSFNATGGDGDCEWRCHGEWALPFEGQGYFDGHLDAWVGLDEDGHMPTSAPARSSPIAATAAAQLVPCTSSSSRRWPRTGCGVTSSRPLMGLLSLPWETPDSALRTASRQWSSMAVRSE
ncbi:hypothetical protein ZWY2020_016658 [Hordeum vulgare]|nr:hypothetical protein ZWY2020_016658 [Hordeum vulgare]